MDISRTGDQKSSVRLFLCPRGIERQAYMADRMSRTIYIDVDGVIAQWDPKATPEETHRRDFMYTRNPVKNVIQGIVDAFWHGVDIIFLTKVYDENARNKRLLWFKDKASIAADIPIQFVPYKERKGDYVADEQSSVLIDDFTANLTEWKGIAVKFQNEINCKKGTPHRLKISTYETSDEIKEDLIRLSSDPNL